MVIPPASLKSKIGRRSHALRLAWGGDEAATEGTTFDDIDGRDEKSFSRILVVSSLLRGLVKANGSYSSSIENSAMVSLSLVLRNSCKARS